MDKLSRLKPMYESRINGDSFIWSDVRAILEIVMLPLLLSLKVKSSETAQILLADSLVNSCTSSNPLSIIVSGISPPVSLSFDIPENHVLNGCR